MSMESPTPVSRYISQNSKKRVFPAGSSSSSVCKEVEVLEIAPPPVNRASKPMSSKQKEVICHEIIDVDMEDDSDDVMLTDGEVGPSGKGKKVLSSSVVEFNNSANGESGSDNSISNNGVAGLQDSTNIDDYNPNLFHDEDEWIDNYYNDILFDDYEMLESQFDHMDIPSGVEAQFPWFPSSGNDLKASMSSTSINPSSQVQPDDINCAPIVNLSQPSFPSKHIQIGSKSASRNKFMDVSELNHDNSHPKGKMSSIWMDHALGLKKSPTPSSINNPNLQPSKDAFGHRYGKEGFQPLPKCKKKSRALASLYSPNPHNFPSNTTYVDNANGSGSHPTVSVPTNAPAYVSIWEDLPLNMLEPALGSSDFMPGGGAFTSWPQDSASNQNGVSAMDTSLSLGVESKHMDEVIRCFDSFKKFDTVEDCSDHHYSKNGSSGKQPPKNWAKRIQEEWKILEKHLPDKIYVRVYESRMDLLRAVIIGADGTPYHGGLYFFDVFFPSSYPNVPPHVHYHSGGLRINPNLYNCGKVCLSLLNTWAGSQKEKWIPGMSTMLQVLVSIQGLILNAKPFFNEPGYANMSGTADGEQRSLVYNERTFMYSLQTMVYSMRRPPKHFEDFVVGHFYKHARDILVSCKAYMEGAQVGCLANGGVQDVDEGDKSSSQQFKAKLGGFIPSLIQAFKKIGAKNCEEFLSLGQREVEPPANPTRPMKFNLNY